MGSNYNPLSAPPYIAGTITISAQQASTPLSLLTLIQAQLEANCPGSALFVRIQADNANSSSHTLKIGAQSNLGGPVSDTNYGRELTSTGTDDWTSGGAGNSAPLADIFVFCSATGKFHVEIYS